MAGTYWACAVGVLVVSFFLGSIPWGVIISRAFYHTDVREHGSGNIGTTNAIRTMGKKGGYAVFALDFAKGVASGLIALAAASALGVVGVESARETLLAASFFGCIIGHIYSPWLKFKGGKGIAVAVGCMFVSFGPVVALLELALFAVLVAATKHVSVGSIAAAAACPFFALYVFWGNPLAWALVTVAAVAVLYAHRGNMARLRAHTESRIGEKKGA